MQRHGSGSVAAFLIAIVVAVVFAVAMAKGKIVCNLPFNY